MHSLLLGALSWDPQIRGFLIVLTAFIILPGSVYMLLATNVGARLGFLLAIAGLSGWIMLLGITWTMYGQGMKGRDPSWKPQEVSHAAKPGDLSSATLHALDGFPKGWSPLPASGNAVLAGAQAAADALITKAGRVPRIGPEGPIIKKPTPVELRYAPEFSDSAGYVVIGGYTKGGDNELFTINHHKFYFRHSPHYVIVQVRPVLALPDLGGAPPAAIADTTKPVTSVILLRDLGSVRFPQMMLVLSSGIIFAITTHALHRRDKQLMAARAAAGPAPATA